MTAANDNHPAITLVAQSLLHIRARNGIDAVADAAEIMIVAAASILAREICPERTRAMLETTSRILPERRR